MSDRAALESGMVDVIKQIMDGSVGLAPEACQTPRRLAVREEYRRLMLELLQTAIHDAMNKRGPMQRAAWTWLRDDGPPLDVRACCEANGIDYDAMIKRLERTFRAGRKTRVPRKYAAGAGVFGPRKRVSA